MIWYRRWQGCYVEWIEKARGRVEKVEMFCQDLLVGCERDGQEYLSTRTI